MKRFILAVLALLLCSGIALAAGGKNQGTTGTGTTSTGTDAKGDATQDRTGR